jgi:hypothetical protein
MKRVREEDHVGEATESPNGRAVNWTQQDRQPSWEEKDDSEGEDFILRSRRRQQYVDTPPTVDDGDGDVEPPGAPMKKRRRIIPWTREGKLRWPGQEEIPRPDAEEEVTLVEDSVDGRESGDSDREDEDGLSFVVDDNSPSVLEEESESERFLGKEALREVRTRVVEQMEKLKRRLASLDAELEALGCVEGSDTLGSETEDEEGEEIVDERTCTKLADSWNAEGSVDDPDYPRGGSRTGGEGRCRRRWTRSG